MLSNRFWLIWFIGFFLPNTSFAQAYLWQEAGGDFNISAAFITPQKIIVGTGAGDYFITTNAGAAWNRRSIGEVQAITSIAFQDSLNGVMSCTEGRIYITSNGGEHWTKSETEISEDILSIKILGGGNYIACGKNSTIIYSSDQGSHWLKAVTPSVMAHLTSISFSEQGIGIAVGTNGVALRTSDSGENWQQITSNTTFDLLSVTIAGNVTLCCGKSDTLLKSTDYGDHWTKIEFPLDVPPMLNNCFAFDTSNYAVACSQGVYLTTSNGGKTWNVNHLGSQLGVDSYLSFQTFTPSIGIMVGAPQTILLTTDQGKSWMPSRVGVPWRSTLSKVQFLDSLEGYAVGGRGSILRTEDGGKTWVLLPQSVTSKDFYDLHFFNSEKGYVTGDSYVLYTSNGGISWERVEPSSVHYYYRMAVVDSLTRFIAGDSIIFKTTDNGNSWQKKIIPHNHSFPFLDDIWFNNTLWGYAISREYDQVADQTVSQLFQTTDGGNTWVGLIEGYVPRMHSFFFRDSLNWFMAGDSGTVWKTTNGGKNWQKTQLATSDHLLDINFSSPMKGLAAGTGGILYSTSDGGQTWVDEHPISRSGKDFRGVNFTSISFPDSLHTIITSLEQVLYGEPDNGKLHVKLYQQLSPSKLHITCYPNPSVSSIVVNITGQIGPELRNVSLKVYDVLGREVLDLSQGLRVTCERDSLKLSANISSLSQGVYTFSLKANNSLAQCKLIVRR